MARTLKPVQPRTILMTWGILLASIIFFGISAFTQISSIPPETTPAEPEDFTTMIYIFAAISTAAAAAAIWFRHNFRKKLEQGRFVELADPSPLYFQACVISWSLVEIIALYGLVLSNLTQEFIYYILFAGPAFLLMLTLIPQPKAIQEKAQQIRNQQGFDAPEQVEYN